MSRPGLDSMSISCKFCKARVLDSLLEDDLSILAGYSLEYARRLINDYYNQVITTKQVNGIFT